MSEPVLTKIRMQNGTWEGLLSGVSGTPEIRVSCRDEITETVEIGETDDPGRWTVRFQLPLEMLSEGTQTFMISDASSNTKLGEFTIIAGDAASDDLRGEVELLRAELDMLKRAFRRHCLETM